MPDADNARPAASADAVAAQPADFELARAALLDITPGDTIGEPAGSIDEGQGTVTVYFEAKKAGYPGWRWTVSIAHVDGADATVLETELTPGDDALLSPDWVPWADRLAEYQATQEAEKAAAGGSDDSDEDSDEDSDDDEFDDDFDDDESDEDDDEDDDGFEGREVLHGGDLDGVDIDELHDEEEE